MFTGIIQNVATVKELKPSPSGARLKLNTHTKLDAALGESISVSGVCLTVAAKQDEVLEFDLSPETLTRSSLGSLQVGGLVNLERALAVGDRLGGHFVSGHVDGVGRVLERLAQGQGCEMLFSCPSDLIGFVAEKGSVCVEGVSLTPFEIRGTQFKVALIPFTLEHTNLGGKKKDDLVNIEVDLLMRYLQRLRENEKVETTNLFERRSLD